MARSQGDFSLVGCTVAPGFRIRTHFELAPDGFEPLNPLRIFCGARRKVCATRCRLTAKPRGAHGRGHKNCCQGKTFMKTTILAGLALGLLTTAAFGQADRLAIQSEPAHNGTPAWHLGPSFPDPTGFTLVDADGTVHVIPREERRAMMGGAPRVPGGNGGAALQPFARLRPQGRLCPQRAGPRRVGPDHGLQILLSLCGAQGHRRRALGGAGFQGQSLGVQALAGRRGPADEIRSRATSWCWKCPKA